MERRRVQIDQRAAEFPNDLEVCQKYAEELQDAIHIGQRIAEDNGALAEVIRTYEADLRVLELKLDDFLKYPEDCRVAMLQQRADLRKFIDEPKRYAQGVEEKSNELMRLKSWMKQLSDGSDRKA